MSRDKRGPMRTTAFQRERVRLANLGRRAAFLRSSAAALLRAGETDAADRFMIEARTLDQLRAGLRD